jgi:arylsulfatase A-like enzyme
MVYFGSVDETGHKVGFHPSVKPYVAAIEVIDGHVGQLLKAIEGRPGYKQENWLILVSTDHGGRGTGHGDGHKVPEICTVFLIVSGTAAEKGKIQKQTYLVDLPVTALVHLGVKIDPAWKLDGQPVGLK